MGVTACSSKLVVPLTNLTVILVSLHVLPSHGWSSTVHCLCTPSLYFICYLCQVWRAGAGCIFKVNRCHFVCVTSRLSWTIGWKPVQFSLQWNLMNKEMVLMATVSLLSCGLPWLPARGLQSKTQHSSTSEVDFFRTLATGCLKS